MTEVLQSFTRNEDGDWSEEDADHTVHVLYSEVTTACGESVGTPDNGWRAVRFAPTCRDCIWATEPELLYKVWEED